MVDIKFLLQTGNKETFDNFFDLFEGSNSDTEKVEETLDREKVEKPIVTLNKIDDKIKGSNTYKKLETKNDKLSSFTSLASGSEVILKIPHKLPQEIEDLPDDVYNLDKVNEVLKKYDLPEFTEETLPKKKNCRRI